jgi:preprotein translocase subunit SecF
MDHLARWSARRMRIAAMEPKNHVSAAISHLRFHVAVMSMVVVLALLVQLMVFGFVHFTDARWQAVEQPALVPPLSVVTTASQKTLDTTTAEETDPGDKAEVADAKIDPRNQTLQQRKSTTLEDLEAQANAKQLSKWHFVMGQFSSLAVTAGVVASVTLALLTILGVIIGGGASVPGIEKAVTACTWALVLALVALPWHEAFASMPFKGVFGGYESMVAASEAVSLEQKSSLALYASNLLMPLAAIGIALIVAARFWAGVSRGVIVTSVSEFDQAVSREISEIQSRGVASNIGPRAVGVLNQPAGAPVKGPAVRPTPPPPAADPPKHGRLI